MGCGTSSYADPVGTDGRCTKDRTGSAYSVSEPGSAPNTPRGEPPTHAVLLGRPDSADVLKRLNQEADRATSADRLRKGGWRCATTGEDLGVSTDAMVPDENGYRVSPLRSAGAGSSPGRTPARSPSGRRLKSWGRMDQNQRNEENRRLRGELHRLESAMQSVRSRLDDELTMKDQQLTVAYKEISRLRTAPPPDRDFGTDGPAGPLGQPSMSVPPPGLSAADWEIARTDPHAARLAEQEAQEAARSQSELNEDLRLYATLGDIDTVRLMLLRGAEIDNVDDEGNTALMMATRKGNTEVCQELLRHGADYAIRNRFRQNPLNTCVRQGHTAVLAVLQHHGCPTQEEEGGYSALFEASRLGKTNVVEMLLRQPSVAVDELNILSETPLFVAIRNGHLQTAECLLRHGANMEQTALHAVRPLMVAAEVGDVAIARLLCDRNCNVNAQDERHLTALQKATREGHLDVLRVLLDYGATAFSNRKFSGQKLFQQPSWGPASIRPASIRPGTAPAGPGLGNYATHSFSAAARVPPQALRVDDLSAMSRWSTDISGAPTGLFGTLRPGTPDSLQGAVPTDWITVHDDETDAAGNPRHGVWQHQSLRQERQARGAGRPASTGDLRQQSSVFTEYSSLGLDASGLEQGSGTPTPKKRAQKKTKKKSKRPPPRDESEAAVRIQAAHRGRQARKQGNAIVLGKGTVTKKKKQQKKTTTKRPPPTDESEAATRIQAVHRGRAARRKRKKKKGGKAQDLGLEMGMAEGEDGGVLASPPPPGHMRPSTATLAPMGGDQLRRTGHDDGRHNHPVRDVVSAGHVTILRRSAGSEEYQEAKLRLLGLSAY